MASRKNGFIAFTLSLSFALVVGFAADTRATLTVDLRAVSTSNGIIVNQKDVLFTGGVGDTVTMDVFATLSGMINDEPLDDFIVYLHGSFLSSTNGLAGDLRAQLTPDFIWLLSSNGLRQDLDGDGDLDVGSNNADLPANFFRANVSDDAPPLAHAKIATLTWTRSSADGGANTLINFRPRVVEHGGLWWIDGFGYYADEDEFLVGVPVLVTSTPETSVWAIGITGLRRRTRLSSIAPR
jgi:hypothetical protein